MPDTARRSARAWHALAQDQAARLRAQRDALDARAWGSAERAFRRQIEREAPDHARRFRSSATPHDDRDAEVLNPDWYPRPPG